MTSDKFWTALFVRLSYMSYDAYDDAHDVVKKLSAIFFTPLSFLLPSSFASSFTFASTAKWMYCFFYSVSLLLLLV